MNRYRVEFVSIDYKVRVSVLLDAKSRRGAFRQFFDGLGVRFCTKVHLLTIDDMLNAPYILTARRTS